MRGRVIQPPSWAKPRGYANGMLFPPGGSMLWVGGQIGWDADQQIVSDEFLPQFGQALANVVAVVEEAGGSVSDIARLTVYVTDRAAYLASGKALGETYRAHMGKHYPAMALIEISALVEPRAMVEIEATAVIYESEG